MALNILIGVGGTGAKIVESTLFLLSSGFGASDDVYVGLVDQDNSNGNVVRTEDLLKLIISLREDFSEGGRNRIKWTGDGATSLLSIGMQPLLKTGAHWRPAEDDLPNLRAVLRHEEMPEPERALFDMLFRGETASPADAEQTMDLSEGYRGRAHVGAAALVSALNFDRPEFLETISELMRRSSAGEEVRIFIAGSLFGGTGAAGFPTIARTLHRLRSATDQRINASRVFIAGALMLPYFAFADPADAQANVITTAQLLPQAKVAIEYYQNLLQQEGVFDRLYVAGWDSMFNLGYHEPGRVEQRNPPLPPELIAALGAADFFTLPAAEVCVERPLVSARRGEGGIGWLDLPMREGLRERLYEQLGGALRFALWWRYRVEPAIDDRGFFGIKTAWLKKLADGTDWQTGTPAARVHLRDYSEALLRWAGAMRLFSRDNTGEFALWNGERLWSRADLRNPPDPISLHDSRTEDETKEDLDALLAANDRNMPPVGAGVVFGELNEKDASVGNEGFGRLVAAVHRATRPFRTE